MPSGSGAGEGAGFGSTGALRPESEGTRPEVSCSRRALSLATVSESRAPRSEGAASSRGAGLAPAFAPLPNVESSHSSTDIPARLAASRAAWYSSGLSPRSFHEAPEFISLTRRLSRSDGQDRPLPNHRR